MNLKEINAIYINDPESFTVETDEALENLLNSSYYVTTFEDSIQTFKDEFIDLLLINIDYAEANGLKFLQIIKQKVPEFPVILFSKTSAEDVEKNLNDIHVDAIIQLPFSNSELIEKIEQLQAKIVEFASNREDRKEEDETGSPGVADSIDSYFKRFNDELRKSHNKRVTKSMDFSIMKSFLYTAYNNFNEFDSAFDDKELKLAKYNLEKAMKLERDLKRKLAFAIEDNYEVVFLQKQSEYATLKHQFEEATVKIQKYRDSLGRITEEMQAKKEELSKIKAGTEAYEKLNKAIKELNKTNVDRVHAIAELKGKINNLEEAMESFRATYIDEFKEVFTSKVEDIKSGIAKSLNVAAFVFDKEIWRRAKQSRAVRDFFETSEIKGLFSSKTYLEYYVQGLDSMAASDGSIKALNYLKELNKKNKINVAIIGNDTDLTTRYKNIIERLDNSLYVTGYLDYKKALEAHKHTAYDVIIIDEYVGKTAASAIITEFKTKASGETEETEFCVRLLNRDHSESYEHAKKMGVRHFLEHNMKEPVFKKKMLEIL